jgi:tetratricopeptide (TPR) repeat protein
MKLGRWLMVLMLLLGFALMVQAQVTAEQVNQLKERLTTLKEKMQSDPENYDQYLEEFNRLSQEYEALKAQYQKESNDKARIASCVKKYNDAKGAYRLKNDDQALELLNTAIGNCPEMHQLYLLRGLVEKRRGNYQAAEENYLQAIEKNAQCPAKAYYNLGLLYMNNLNRPAEAVANFQKTLGCDSTYAKAYYQLGKYYAEKKQSKNAIKSLRLALKYNSKYTLASTELSRLLLEAGNCTQAHKVAKDALAQAKPRYKSKLSFQMARALNACGKHQAALNAAREGMKYTKKIRSNKSYIKGGLHFAAGQALEAMEQWQAAVDEYRQAAKSREWRQNAEYQIEKKIKREHPEVQ